MDSYIIKHAFRHFLPAAILTGIILQVRIITDCIIVGQLIGPDAVSAINLYIPLEEVVYSFICVIVLGASFLGAECVGRQDYRKASDGSIQGNFEIRIVDKPALTQVSFKAGGTPFNPIVRYDNTAYERFLKGEPLELELELVNKLSDRITHQYLYGVNVTVLEFLKA